MPAPNHKQPRLLRAYSWFPLALPDMMVTDVGCYQLLLVLTATTSSPNAWRALRPCQECPPIQAAPCAHLSLSFVFCMLSPSLHSFSRSSPSPSSPSRPHVCHYYLFMACSKNRLENIAEHICIYIYIYIYIYRMGLAVASVASVREGAVGLGLGGGRSSLR